MITKDGKVSCECCDPCFNAGFSLEPEITSEQYNALLRGGILAYSISAILSSPCSESPTPPGYSQSESISITEKICFVSEFLPVAPEGSGVGNELIFQWGPNNQQKNLRVAVRSFGGFSGPEWGIVKPGAGQNNPFVNIGSLSITIDGETIPCALFVASGTPSAPFDCSYTLNVNVSFTSNPES